MSIVLIGLPACGKTTVGEALAERLRVGFADTDVLVEQRTGKLIREIFAEDGEACFRELELQAAVEALAGHGVVSLGGGAVMTEAIQDLLAGHQVVWLDVSVVTLTRRAGMNQLRPLLLGDVRSQLAELAAIRLPVYERLATCRIDAEQPVETIVDQIFEVLRTFSHRVEPVAFSTFQTNQPQYVAFPDDANPTCCGGLDGDSLFATGSTRCENARETTVIPVCGERAYEVVVGRGVAGRVGSAVGASRVAIIHPPVMGRRAAELAERLPRASLIEVPPGESAKSVAVLEGCWRGLAQAGFTRSDAVVGLGGGTTTDLAGFVAATYLRGVSHVAIPTTVVGMADAAVGGKTGIDLPEGKNLVGAFWEPKVVLCDLDLLAGLPDEQVRAGLAEVVKCGFIADPQILEAVRADPMSARDVASPALAEILTRAIRVKAEVVSGDFREQDDPNRVGRAALNYGHTLGHAIEKHEHFTWGHGNAVAVGMVFAAELSRRLGLIGPDEVTGHRSLLESLELPVSYDGATWDDLRATMGLDKKARGSHLRMVLLEGVGRTVIVADPDEEALRESYRAIGGRA